MKIYAVKITFITSLTILLLALAAITNRANAQSFTLTPANGTIGVGASQDIEIKASNPPAQNTAEIHLTVPTSILEITNLVLPTTGYLTFTGSGCSAQQTAAQACFIIAKTGGADLTDGELLGTITVQGKANGIANADFITGTAYSGGTNYTGTGGTFTIGAGGGSALSGTGNPLPNSGIADEENSLLLLATTSFFMAAVSFYFLDYFRRYYATEAILFRRRRRTEEFRGKFEEKLL